MAIPHSECAAMASTVQHVVAAIMRKPTAQQRREAFFAAFDRADRDHQRALYGAVAILLSRLDEMPPAKTGAA